jgi:hypothetical protein
MNKIYHIKGVDLKTELIIGFSIIPFILILGELAVNLYSNFTGVAFRNIPYFIFLAGGVTGLTIGLIVAKLLGKKMCATWEIQLQNELLSIGFKNRKWKMKLNEISKFKIYGNANFKYISIFKDDEKIKMRFGNSGLTPFSAHDDMKQLNDFINELQDYLNKNFVKKDSAVAKSPKGTLKLIYLRK